MVYLNFTDLSEEAQQRLLEVSRSELKNDMAIPFAVMPGNIILMLKRCWNRKPYGIYTPILTYLISE